MMIVIYLQIDFESQDEQGNKKAASKVLFGHKVRFFWINDLHRLQNIMKN